MTALPPEERRQALRQGMRNLHARGIHCGQCAGVCCTHLANSMRITREEAEDLKDFLISEGRWNEELRVRLSETIRTYRLDQEMGDGRRALRKTYTCPFYAGGKLGCTIAPAHKPYGCLAFNPRSPGLTKGGDCVSDQELLEPLYREEEETHPIPIALLRLNPPPLS